MTKLTWDKVFLYFKKTHPNLSKEVTYWCPSDYLTIKLYFKNGQIALYNYFDKRMIFIKETWIKEKEK